ncbi:MAG: DEAD/DEAH box helicase, partial [Clostridiales bacterium]|nr:DEAD/DEAH box helicase [Clostridiales bacterium]MDY4113347.1 DEAD/DEAH box helicase [Roseburia sp.]
CPASLVYNWQKEVERFAPELHTVIVTGLANERKEIIRGSKEGEILITSYDLLKRDVECYQDIVFAIQVIDEAQYIKNPGTQAAKGVKKITAAFKLALTGTPIENRLSELWSIFDYLMPGFLYTYQRFREEIEIPIIVNRDENKMERLQRMIRPFVLRRLKSEVLQDLPEKLEENVYARMEGEQQALYAAHVQRMKQMLDGKSEQEFRSEKLQILSELTRLRQICCDPALLFEGYHGTSAKTEMCMELLLNAVNGGHKVLLFSQFTSMLDRLAERLAKEGIRYYMLTGAVSKEKRMQMVESFQQDDIPVFCISLKAGGTGLNLTAADIVIHYDPWWNVAVQNQATDRAHRIGQKHVVTVYRLVSEGTIEEKIMEIQEKKKQLAKQVLEGEGMDSGSITREELLELLE